MTQTARISLGELIEKIAAQAEAGNGLSFKSLQRMAGRRVAGPLLLFPGLIVVSPLSLVPTLPTLVAVIVILVAGQIVIGRKLIWLPRKLRNGTMSVERTRTLVKFLRPAAAWLSKVSKPRLTFLVGGLGIRLAAGICILVALTMPPLEFFPGASTAAGVVISTFGLAMTMQDGVLLIASLLLVIGAVALFWMLIF